MTKQTLLRHIRSFSVNARNIHLSIQEARNVAVANGLMTNKTPKGKLTKKVHKEIGTKPNIDIN